MNGSLPISRDISCNRVGGMCRSIADMWRLCRLLGINFGVGWLKRPKMQHVQYSYIVVHILCCSFENRIL